MAESKCFTPLTLLTLLTPNWDLYANENISRREETSRPWELELPTKVDYPDRKEAKEMEMMGNKRSCHWRQT